MRRIVLILATCTALYSASAQNGTVLEGLSLTSSAFGGEIAYAVYLPPDYYTSTRDYPVLYLLHGYTDDETGWIQYGEVDRIVSGAIASGEVTPMVIVMPDGGVSWYINDAAGEHRWMDMFVEELIPQVEDSFRIRSEKRFRGIAGQSMGGHGALINAMRHPDLFAGCIAFSAGLWTEEDMLDVPIEDYNTYFGFIYGKREEGDPLADHFRENSVLYQARNADADKLKQVAYWIDCGDDDFLTAVNAKLHVALKERDIPHEYRVRDGGHTWTYWRTGLVPGLSFLSDLFRQK